MTDWKCHKNLAQDADSDKTGIVRVCVRVCVCVFYIPTCPTLLFAAAFNLLSVPQAHNVKKNKIIIF